MNDEKQDIGVMENYTYDLAFGADENDFKLETTTDNHVCKEGYFLYVEGTEYGGIIDCIGIKTASGKLTYSGRTWHGILQSKIIEPPPGEDYLICDGEANSVLGTLIEKLGLTGMFLANTENSRLTISNYKIHRYITGYDGIRKMLASAGAGLHISFTGGFAVLSAVPLVDYSEDEEISSSSFEFDVEKSYKKVNHMVCLGKGDLKDRNVIHLYADADGNISKTQTFFGMDEITAVYDNANTESGEELEKGGMDALLKKRNTDKLKVNFDSGKNYGIGDTVGACEEITGISVSRQISKKIVTIQNDEITVSYKVGE